MADLKIFSILINWDDSDVGEQGTYAWTGRAADAEHAEQQAREAMWTQEYGPDEPPEDWNEVFGSVVECSEGALWEADAMEKAIRALLAKPNDQECWKAALAIIARIDGEKANV